MVRSWLPIVAFAAPLMAAALLVLGSGIASGQAPKSAAAPSHKVAIHVDDNDAKVMNLALNNAKNVLEYYKTKGETVAIEIVTYGPGLHMLRSDTSPVKQRIGEMSLAAPEVSFAACANTQIGMSKQEGKDVPLMSEAQVVPSGVVRLIELQEKGYSYIRPSGR
jgi:intracellular sulfur oxidation DsrE/DsrF family protein